MVSNMTVALTAFVALSVVLIGVLAVSMRMRHKYSPNLIGALIGALMCFVLLEAIPALI
jgi:TRAP-type mannitol/chloroaromatic compound transport system permease large subunit